MSDTNPTPLTSQDAVRLARFAHPGRAWQPSGTGYAVAVIGKELAGTQMIGFAVTSLNDLALAEQRVCAAGYCREYSEAVGDIVCSPASVFDINPWLLICATAEQRARALLALLDAHHELEPVEQAKRQARLDALRWVCSQAMCADWHDLGERIKAEIARLESNA